jgi:hypothetical protein
MTYRELLEELVNMPEERLDDTVMVHDSYEEEYIAVIDVREADPKWVDELDPGHYYLVLKA